MVSRRPDNPFIGDVKFVSGRTGGILGYPPTEFVRNPNLWRSLIHPEEVAALAASTAAIYGSKAPGTRLYRLQHGTTGQYRWVEDRVVPQLDAGGNLVGIFGVGREITEQKKTEEALRASEEFARNLIESSLDMIIAVDRDRKISCSTERRTFGREEVGPRDVLGANRKRDGSE